MKAPYCDGCGQECEELPIIWSVRGDGFIYTLGYLLAYFFCSLECVPAMWRRP